MTFYSNTSLFWLIPALLFSVGIAYFYYRKQEVFLSGNRRKKSALIGLRGTVLFLLLLVLFDILIERQVSKVEKPLFVVLTDNSSSMLNYGDSAKVKERSLQFSRKLKEAYGDRFDVLELRIADTISNSKLDFKGNQTDLNSGFHYVFEQFYNRNIGGIALLTDGNYNKGIDPIYTAEKISLTPIFALGVGDTILKRDQLIRNVNVNSVAFLDNEFPVEITIESKKLKGRKSNLTISRAGKTLVSKEIKPEEDHAFITEQFILKADAPGIQSYEVKLQVLEGEESTKNNSKRFYIEVIDTRSKILLLATSPHPDIAAIKSALDGNDRVEVTSATVEKYDGNLKDIELVIAHGVKKGKSIEFIKTFEKKGISVLYILTGDSDPQLFNGQFSGGSVPLSGRFDNVQAYENEGFQLFEKSEKVSELVQSAPPIYTRFGEFKSGVGDVWLYQRLGGVKKKDPVLIFKSVAGRKNAYLLGEGIWRWKLNEYVRTGENEGFNELIQRTAQYLTVKRNSEPLRVYLPDHFNSEEEIEIRAEFLNDALEPIVKAEVDMVLTSESGKKFNYRFAKRTSDYFVNIGKHKPGAYEFEVTASYNGKKYLKKGAFIVEELTIESLTTHSDFGLLQQLADQSGGEFYELKDWQRMLADLSKREDLVNIEYSESKFANLIDITLLLLAALFLLSLEWFIRRYSGGY